MSDNSLKQAIAAIYDMELNNYFMTRMRQSLQASLSKRVERDDDEPDKPRKPIEPLMPAKPSIITALISGAVFGAIAGAVVKFVVGLIAYLVEYNKADDTEAVLDRAPSIIFGGFWTWVLVAALIVGAVMAIAELSKLKEYKLKLNKYKSNIKVYENDLKMYETAVEEYEKELDLADERWEQKLAARESAIRHQMMLLADKLYDSTVLLNELYDKVGIDAKYRNIVPIAYMNEFINLGISTKLEGADGLYYLTMKELRMDQMQYKLDTIITKLDSLIDKQHSIYFELMNINNKCDTMAIATARQTDALLNQNSLIKDQNALLSKIERDSEITRYNSERIAKEQEYQSYMTRYQSW